MRCESHASFEFPAARPGLRPPRFVAIGGGTGLPTVLQGLTQLLRTMPLFSDGPWDPSDCLNAIVTVTDDGGSSGWMRRELGILPPGDARNCLAALASHTSPLSRVLQYRFTSGGHLSGHSVGNLVLAALTQMTGDFAKAVEQLGNMLGISGRVFPSTAENVTLVAEFASGEVVRGETAIASHGRPIRRLSLERPVRPLPDALRALVNADAVILGPGSLYTSLLPNLLVGGVAPTLFGSTNVRIYVANLMTQPGETDGFSLEDHLRVLREHCGTGLFDYVLVNTRPISAATMREQATHGAEPVRIETEADVTEEGIRIVRGDFARELPGGEVRHSPEALSETILQLIRERGATRLAGESDRSETKGLRGRGRSTVPPTAVLANPQNI